MGRIASLTALFLVAGLQTAAAQTRVVAAENFYGDIARQIGSATVQVTSILSNPDQDPHLFEASPSVARAIAAADVVAYNGVDYDPWMAKLLAAGARTQRVIVVADLTGATPGSNPHLWYAPATIPAFARALAEQLTLADPAHAGAFNTGLQRVLASLQTLQDRVAALRRRYAGTPVTATEPVFGLMAQALGLDMRNERFQLAVMNDTEPSASDVAAVEQDLRQRRVKLFIYNSQATDTAAKRLLTIARTAGVPVIGVTETEPAGMDYQTWMMSQLDALDRALSPHP